MDKTMNTEDALMLENLINKYGLRELASRISFICGEKAAHVGENWQDIQTAKVWMDASVIFDGANGRLEDISAEI